MKQAFVTHITTFKKKKNYEFNKSEKNYTLWKYIKILFLLLYFGESLRHGDF